MPVVSPADLPPVPGPRPPAESPSAESPPAESPPAESPPAESPSAESPPEGPAWPAAAPAPAAATTWPAPAPAAPTLPAPAPAAAPTWPAPAPAAAPTWPPPAPAGTGLAPAAESETQPGGRRPRGARRITAVVALVVLGLVGVGGGAAALVREMGRAATNSEVAAALATEIASRWQRLPAGKIFPATITYDNAQNDQATARLVSIVPATSCQAALTPHAFAIVRPLGCHTMLRATYTDASGTLAASIGIAVMASPSGADAAWLTLTPMPVVGGMHAVPIPGTVAAGFSDASLGAAGAQVGGPYVLLYAAGYTDGLPGRFARQNYELVQLGSGIVAAVESVLTGHPAPCTMKDIRC